MKFDDLGICLLVDFSGFCVFCCFDFVSVCLDLGLVGFVVLEFGLSEIWWFLVSAGVCRSVGHTRISWSFDSFWVSFASCGFSEFVTFGVFACFLFVLTLNLLFRCLFVLCVCVFVTLVFWVV